MVDGDSLDLVKDVGMPDRFTPYSLYVTCLLSLSWFIVAPPMMSTAFTAPPGASLANATLDEEHDYGFTTVAADFPVSAVTAEFATTAYSVGSMLFGQIPCVISDKYGRLQVTVASALGTTIACIISATATNYTIFLIGRLLQGAFFMAISSVAWVLASESMPASCHGKASIIFGTMWSLGYMFTAPIAYLTREWRMFYYVTAAAPLVFAVLVALTVRESLSFLLASGRMKEAEEWISRSEKLGGPKFKRERLDALLKEEAALLEDGNSTTEELLSYKSFVRFLKSNRMGIYLVINLYMWMGDVLVYNGISLTSTGVKGVDPYMLFVVSGFIEIPAAILLPIFMDSIGRRPTVIATHALTALTSIALCFVRSDDGGALYVGLWLAAKFGVAASFFSLYIYGAEIFPVTHRNICIGLCGALANIGAIGAPFTAHLAAAHPIAVYLLYAVLSGIAAFLVSFLPETLHK